MSHITVWDCRTAESFLYDTLSERNARAMVRMVETSSSFLIADASSDVGPRIHPRIRTSWYTRDLPPEQDEATAVREYPCSPGCPVIKHRH